MQIELRELTKHSKRALMVLLMSLSSVGSSALAQEEDRDRYFNTSLNPVTNQLQSILANPDQHRYATANLVHGEDGRLEQTETVRTAGAKWPAIVLPQEVKLDPRSAVAVKAVRQATGLDDATGVVGGVARTAGQVLGGTVVGAAGGALGDAVDTIVGGAGGDLSGTGANILSGNVAATAMAVGFQQAIARAQLPESTMPLAKELLNQHTIMDADNAAAMERNQSAAAIDFVRSYLQNFTSDAGNKWNKLRNEVFLPIAILLLLPGAVAAQGKSIVAQGFGIFGNVGPFDGIIRAIIAIFLIPATGLVVNYGIDVSNCITKSIRDTYHSMFHSDMYADAVAAHVRAFPLRRPSENLNYVPSDSGWDSTGPVVRDHRDHGTAGGPIVRDYRDQRTSGGPIVRDHRDQDQGASGGPIVRDHRDQQGPIIRDHRGDSAPESILTQLERAIEGPTIRDHRGGAGTNATGALGSPFARMERRSLGIKLEDPAAGISDNRPGKEYERLPYWVHSLRLGFNGMNAALATTWTILCAFQMAYLYYLWFVGPIVAALWVWPMAQLRQALPNWVDGVVTLCFWSLFWNTSVVLMACFRGVDDTGTVMMTALNFLSTACVKSAFDFSGLVKAAGAEAGKMIEKSKKEKEESKSGGGLLGGVTGGLLGGVTEKLESVAGGALQSLPGAGAASGIMGMAGGSSSGGLLSSLAGGSSLGGLGSSILGAAGGSGLGSLGSLGALGIVPPPLAAVVSATGSGDGSSGLGGILGSVTSPLQSITSITNSENLFQTLAPLALTAATGGAGAPLAAGLLSGGAGASLGAGLLGQGGGASLGAGLLGQLAGAGAGGSALGLGASLMLGPAAPIGLAVGASLLGEIAGGGNSGSTPPASGADVSGASASLTASVDVAGVLGGLLGQSGGGQGAGLTQLVEGAAGAMQMGPQALAGLAAAEVVRSIASEIKVPGADSLKRSRPANGYADPGFIPPVPETAWESPQTVPEVEIGLSLQVGPPASLDWGNTAADVPPPPREYGDAESYRKRRSVNKLMGALGKAAAPRTPSVH